MNIYVSQVADISLSPIILIVVISDNASEIIDKSTVFVCLFQQFLG